VSITYALIHEWLTPQATGGSELVVKEILQLFQDANLYALIDFESTNPASYLYKRQIGTTFLQKFPGAKQGVQKYLPLLPLAIEQIDVRDYDIVLSSSHAVAKGILTTPYQLHICYCHTPMRYAWDLTFDYLQHNRAGRGIAGIFTRLLLHYIRQWDVETANRVDYFIANSQHTAKRIWRCYRRAAKVIYPPVDVDNFIYQENKEDFYVTVCRLVSYKNVALMVRAFNQLGRNLVVIGTGKELQYLRQIAQPNVQILGWQSDQLVAEYLAKAKAFIYAACEDFGMALVEAQASGTPVIAFGNGGALETVRDLRKYRDTATGIWFNPQTEAGLIEAVQLFEVNQAKFHAEEVRSHAMKFSKAVFQHQYGEFVDHCYREFQLGKRFIDVARF
jgi:glycosyltransferase involved in cell wall biosynthesis